MGLGLAILQNLILTSTWYCPEVCTPSPTTFNGEALGAWHPSFSRNPKADRSKGLQGPTEHTRATCRVIRAPWPLAKAQQISGRALKGPRVFQQRPMGPRAQELFRASSAKGWCLCYLLLCYMACSLFLSAISTETDSTNV